MQDRGTNGDGPRQPQGKQNNAGYHAPTPPKIPLNHIQSLVPRLTTTINDIDSFRSLLIQGAQDGSMPSWDVTLQRYSLLLGRITALSTYISQPPPQSNPRIPTSTKPVLQSYLAHPLNALSTTDPEISPFAPDVYFQVLNTLPLPSLSTAQDDLLARPGWTNLDDLRKMDEGTLNGFEGRIRDRLGRESRIAKSLIEKIEDKMGEVDWTMRVDQEDEGEDGSLFGGGDDDDHDADEDGGAKDPKMDPTAEEQKGGAGPQPNPREGWTIQDYVKYMETGLPPASHT